MLNLSILDWTYGSFLYRDSLHIAGPSFWGLINPDWSLCHQGRQQSPIDINPGKILFDPMLEDITITDVKVGVFQSASIIPQRID